MGYISDLNINGATQLIGTSLYGTCTTAASVITKDVVLPNFNKLITGITVHVKFTNSNSAESPCLNVNGTGSKVIYRYGITPAGNNAATSWNAGSVVSFTYDGKCWMLNDWINTDTHLITGVKGDAEKKYRTGEINITPANIGLGNVNNTSDADKPVSLAQANAIIAVQQQALNAYQAALESRPIIIDVPSSPNTQLTINNSYVTSKHIADNQYVTAGADVTVKTYDNGDVNIECTEGIPAFRLYLVLSRNL